MSDSDSVWTDGIVPETPEITNLHSTGNKSVLYFLYTYFNCSFLKITLYFRIGEN